ncbi:MAG TPA: hypothetical protein VGS80_14525, partial [Ktedonobacterales bacterium]|nr:hypothetical protein [Ktedonobacterales bacterium]
FCTQPLQVSDDATCVPPPPSQASATPLLNDTAPDCDASSFTWTATDNLQKSCPGTGGTLIGATALQTLACLDAQSAVTSNGYVSVLVTSQTGNGSAVLAFRQGEQTAPGNRFVLTGYYFKVSPAQNTYLLYKYDGHATQRITSNSLPQLAQHFVMGVLFSGNHFTLYINGHEVGAGFEAHGVTSTGWFGICADSGAEVFKYALVYSSSS